MWNNPEASYTLAELEEVETSNHKSLAIAPLSKKMFIADDTKKFVGRSVMLKQKDLKELLEILAESASSSSSSGSEEEDEEEEEEED